MQINSEFSRDSFVEIVFTTNDNHKSKEYAGRVAKVLNTPVHPSTWYTLQLIDYPQAIIKLQPTAMKPAYDYIDSGSNLPDVSLTFLPAVPKSAASISLSSPLSSRPPSSSVPLSSSQSVSTLSTNDALPTPIHLLTLGKEVVILGTDSVVQRQPHLIGREGIIQEVPVHPATWYKIAFPDGSLSTLRPSALRLLRPDDDNLKYISPGQRLSHQRSTLGNSVPSSTSGDNVKLDKPLKSEFKSENNSSASKSNLVDRNALLSLDSCVWNNQIVKITGTGRLVGQIGRILKSGNGWIQVLTQYGEIAKRAHELELVLPEESSNCSGINPNSMRSRSCEVDSLNGFQRKTEVQHSNPVDPDYSVSIQDLVYYRNCNLPTLVEQYHRFCESCFSEKQSNARFCWNEKCTESPIFWELEQANATREPAGKEDARLETCADSVGESVSVSAVGAERDLSDFRVLSTDSITSADNNMIGLLSLSNNSSSVESVETTTTEADLSSNLSAAARSDSEQSLSLKLHGDRAEYDNLSKPITDYAFDYFKFASSVLVELLDPECPKSASGRSVDFGSKRKLTGRSYGLGSASAYKSHCNLVDLSKKSSILKSKSDQGLGSYFSSASKSPININFLENGPVGLDLDSLQDFGKNSTYSTSADSGKKSERLKSFVPINDSFAEGAIGCCDKSNVFLLDSNSGSTDMSRTEWTEHDQTISEPHRAHGKDYIHMQGSSRVNFQDVEANLYFDKGLDDRSCTKF